MTFISAGLNALRGRRMRYRRLKTLDPTRRSSAAGQFEEDLRSKIVGQNAAVACVSDLYQTFLAGMHMPQRPVGNLLFLGPTGAGKTRVVEAVAEVLFGDCRAVVKVDCAEFQHSHDIAKLIGSPPGYVGHRDTRPALSQEALDQRHTEKLKLTLLLFDEIEKASDALWQMLLGILDRAELTLGDNRQVDLSKCMIFMTSNLGAREMERLSAGGSGFTPPHEEEEGFDAKMEGAALAAARHHFSPEFMNRIDRTIVFHTLRDSDLEAILEIELATVQRRIFDSVRQPFLITSSPEAKHWLLYEGQDRRYGARHLKRAVEKNVVAPLARIIATGQLTHGDVVHIELDRTSGSLCFGGESTGIDLKFLPPAPNRTAARHLIAG